MNRRSLLFALIVCGGLVMVGIWQLNAPKTQARVLKPAEADVFAEDLEGASKPLETTGAPQLDDYTPPPRKLAPPPKAPLVENDPAKGRVWLRLLDSRTNQPVAETRCTLIRGWANESFWELSRIAGQRSTDPDGLMSFTSGIVETVDDEGYRERAWDFCLDIDDVVWFTLPVPEGWLPVGSVYEIAEQMETLCSAARSEPIDIMVAPEATLRIVARDEWGQPLPDARIEFDAVAEDTGKHVWLDVVKDLPDMVSTVAWSEWVDECREGVSRSSVTAEFEGEGVREGGHGPTIFIPDATDYRGSILIRGLPLVRFGAVAYQSGFGFGDATIDLEPGANELNVYLRPTATCTLNVRIEWLGEPLQLEEAPELQLTPTGPCGGDGTFGDGGSGSYTWLLAPSGGTVWEGQIRTLLPGFWSVEARFYNGSYDGRARVQLQAFETRSVTLYCGDGALAHWTPIIRLNGKQLEQSSIRILGGEHEEPAAETIWFDSASAVTTALGLVAGAYTVWIPTLQPVQVSLLPGEKRSDVFELQCATVRFSIDAPLADLLSFEGADVQLNLYPGDEWDSADEHLLSIDADLRKADEAYDQLNPGVVRVWTIPLARYSWHLIGTDQEIQGSIDLMTAGSTSVHFGLRNLPGYELCEIEFSGFTEGEEPHIEFSDDGTAHAAINAFSGPPDEPDFIADVSYVVGDRSAIDVLYSADKKVVYAFGARGGAQLLVYEVTYTSFRVSFPGRLVVTPGHLGAPLDGKLLLDAGESEFTWQVTVFHEDGGYGVGQAGDELEMAIGWITLVVSRQPSGGLPEVARVQVRLSTEPQTLNLNSLAYEPFAQVTLVFKGRGSPDSPFDAWWYGDAKPAPLMLALDQSFGGAPRYVGLGSADRVMPDGRLEFTYDNRMLPPGRYKVIPWPGAAEKYCKTFTLAPGETSSVVVQGG